MSKNWRNVFDERDINGPGFVLEGEYNDTEISLYGVAHGERFLDGYRKEFESKIPESDAWVFESGGVSFSDGEGIEGDFRDMEFMKEVSDMVLNHPGLVYELDPTNPGLVGIDGAALGLGGLLTYNEIEDFREDSDDQMTRRELMGRTAKIPTGGYLLGTNTLGVIIRNVFGGLISGDKNNVSTYGLDDRASISAFDYRNQEIAAGLQSIAEETDHENIVAVHGAGHCRPVAHYLVEGSDEYKEIPYSVFEAVDSDPSKFLAEGTEWEEVETEF